MEEGNLWSLTDAPQHLREALQLRNLVLPKIEQRECAQKCLHAPLASHRALAHDRAPANLHTCKGTVHTAVHFHCYNFYIAHFLENDVAMRLHSCLITFTMQSLTK